MYFCYLFINRLNKPEESYNNPTRYTPHCKIVLDDTRQIQEGVRQIMAGQRSWRPAINSSLLVPEDAGDKNRRDEYEKNSFPEDSQNNKQEPFDSDYQEALESNNKFYITLVQGKIIQIIESNILEKFIIVRIYIRIRYLDSINSDHFVHIDSPAIDILQIEKLRNV